MLTNIASDLDHLLTDLCHMHPYGSGDQLGGPGERLGRGLEAGESRSNTMQTAGTQNSGDTMGKDSFLSSAEGASNSRRTMGDTTASSQSLVSSSSDNLSADSGHDEKTHGTKSPLVFDPNHFGSITRSLATATTSTMTVQVSSGGGGSHDKDSHSSNDLRPITLVERLTKTHTIWLLSQMSRAGAVHLLKDRETGVFIIRKSSQPMSLALSVQNRLTDRSTVDHYLIEASDYGMRLQGSAHFFHSIPSLIAHYIENLDELPYRLTLPLVILQARSSRELASLAMLGQDFWLSPVSRKTSAPSFAVGGGSMVPCGSGLHKSCSEPIDIRQPLLQTQVKVVRQHVAAGQPGHPQVAASQSVSDFSDFTAHQQLVEEQQHVFHEQFSAQVAVTTTHSHVSGVPHRVFASPPTNAHLGFGPHLLRLGRGANDTPVSTDSSGDEGGGLPHIHLVGFPPEMGGAMSDASSQTDFSSLNKGDPKSRPNLYSMTPVELLNLPDNTYFRSTLSDKMSDYEDIWRSSFYDTDSMRNGSVHGGGGGYDVGSAVTSARSDFTRFFAMNGDVVGAVRESSAPPQLSVPRPQSSGPSKPVIQQPSTVTSNFTKPERTKSFKKRFLHPLAGRLSRLKSSSDSSLATISSPVYAEPADAVVFREKQRSSRTRVRRRSAPSVSSQTFPAETSNAERGQQAGEVSRLAAIPSQDSINQSELLKARPRRADMMPKRSGSVQVKPQRVMELAGRGGGVSRSQSMRTPHEAARLGGKKPGWQERFNRLKLGTKVLSHSGSPYATTAHAPAQPKLDESLFEGEEEHAANPSSVPHPFPVHPVYQQSQLPQPKPKDVHRGSYFSESSTVQDIISCAMPELMVRPLQIQQMMNQAGKPLSEYDNFNPYAPPSASSHGTIFCTPWEGGVVDTLIKSTSSASSCKLPPAMDLQERVLKWQEANQSFQQHYHHHPQMQQQQHQQLHGQQQMGVEHQDQPVQLQKSSQQHTVVKQAHTVQTANVVSGKTNVFATQSVQHNNSSSNVNIASPRPGVPTTTQDNVVTVAKVKPQPQPRITVQQRDRAAAMAVAQQKAISQAVTQVMGQGSVPITVNAQQQQQHLQLQQHYLHQQHLQQQQQQRPVSMFLQSQAKQQQQHAQLVRSMSNPNQSQHAFAQQQQITNRNILHQSSQSHHQLSSHRHQQSCLHKSVVTEGSSLVIPDVINCHHITMATSSAADLSDDEVLMPSLYDSSTLQHNVHHKPSKSTPGSKIREYIYKLSQDHSTTFGSTIENFIQCTVDSQEKNPHHVMRNVRQFMTGIKNYLVKHGEGQLEDLIERERNKLGTNEILNIDALIETTLHVCVLRPLKHHIYRLFVDFHGRNNSLESMSRNIKYARTKTAEEIGIKPGLVPPQASDMERIKHYLDKMQRAYSPLKKLENLLGATSTIYSCVKIQGNPVPSRGPASLGADDFLPLLIYVLVHCGLVSAEIEADYMWGLLHPSVLTGEGGYYLTTLSSAVLILKNFQQAHETKAASLEGNLPTLGEVQGFLKIAFPDELRDTLLWKTLPVRPNMTTKDVCAMIAHKFKITNPQDFGLILLCNGEESQLTDNQCPQIIKRDNLTSGKESFFAYKRLGANIAWPSSMKHS